MNLIEQIKVNDVSIDGYQGTYYTESPEYVQVTTDSEGKILEGIKTDGSKYIGGDLQVNGNIINDGIQETLDATVEEIQKEVNEMMEESSEKLSYFETIDNPEWIKLLTDAQDRIIAGVRKDGSVSFPGGVERVASEEEIAELKDTDDALSDRITILENIEEISNKRLICCDGDSLTYSQLGVDEGNQRSNNPWPELLQNSLGNGYKVFNYGIPGAPSPTIVANASCYRVLNDFTIPELGTTSFFTLCFLRDNTNLSSWTFGPVISAGTMGGTNPVWINGVKGELLYVKENGVNGAKFRRESPGSAVPVKSGDLILTNEFVNNKNADHIIFIGANHGWRFINEQGNEKSIEDTDSINEWLAQNDTVINTSEDLYIVISFHNWYHELSPSGPVEPWAGEALCREKYGDHYINLREYFSTDAIQDAIDRGYLPDDGTYPTELDTRWMSYGRPAVSVRSSDGVHFTDVGYKLLGDLITKTYKNLLKKKILGTL